MRNLLRYIIFLTVLFYLEHPTYADGGSSLKGFVKDAYKKNMLEDAHVILEEASKGTTTNRKGMFLFSSIEPGEYTLVIRHLGYLDYRETVKLDSGANVLNIFLKPTIIEIDPVTITATLNRQPVSVVPGKVDQINTDEISLMPINTIDQSLSSLANVYVYRPWGVYSKSASVTMRGLPGSSRTLILLDGIPLNHAGGGSINWNVIEPRSVEEIEVVKGPSSAIYGNNAMTGVISVRTKRPENPLEGGVRTFGGTYGTYGGSFDLGGIDLYKGKGMFWKINGLVRRGDGYINEPEETRDSLSSKLNLKEYIAGVILGYRFDSVTTLEAEFKYYEGKFGTGRKVFEPDGSFDEYHNYLSVIRFDGYVGKFKLNTRFFYQRENYLRQNEGMNSSGKYKLSDTRSTKDDFGLWLNMSKPIRSHLLTIGGEAKMGDLDANIVYRTSTDNVRYGGNIFFAGLFIQDEIRLFRKLSAIAGLRFDYANYYNGFQTITNPTSNTGFLEDISDEFEDNSWNRLSPKLALQYQVMKILSAYASVSTGFMPPKIDDLTKSGKISKGFKLANPKLLPENAINYELGMKLLMNDRLSVEPSLYYTRGTDFQYFVATGDSVDTGGTTLKPVLQRQNISDVEIKGLEISASLLIIDNVLLNASYSYNDSRILEYHDQTGTGKDITGNFLIEVPEQLAYASISWKNRIVNVLFNWNFTGEEWYDDENTIKIPAHSEFNIKLSKHFPKNFGLSLTINNILNDLTLDRKGTMPPGRFVMGEITFDF